MRIWIRSDLHAEGIEDVGRLFREPPEHDVAVIAGDVNYGARRVIEAIDQAADRPVVYVLGNHEAYHRTLSTEIAQGREASARSRHTHFLEQSMWIHDSVRFLGATLWTNFDLHGFDARDLAMRHAAGHSSDYELIMLRERSPLDLSIRAHVLRPADTRRIHLETVAWLEERFAESFDGPTVVITHHAPARQSIAAQFVGDPLTPAYVSDLSSQIARWQPALWVHGHTHDRFDYHLGRTRVICNPRGFFHGVDAEDSGYDPRLVVNV